MVLARSSREVKSAEVVLKAQPHLMVLELVPVRLTGSSREVKLEEAPPKAQPHQMVLELEPEQLAGQVFHLKASLALQHLGLL